ncbi:hypothetical protein [Streptomyces sp. NPDC051219]|uniref:hypothetical protein n=1 Tax=Streptomyces sp. NPDC051219 TaxID=3155283 RepID=UPI003426248E
MKSPRCTVCGWEPAAARMPDARARERLAAWRWDFRAAMLASGGRFPETAAAVGRGRRIHPQLRSLIRQAPVPAGDRTPGVTAGFGESTDRAPTGELAGAVSVLTALAADELDAAHFLGVSPSGLALEEVGRDDTGALRSRTERSAALDWTEAVTWLRHSPPERQFLLAGGIGASAPYGAGGVPRATDVAWENGLGTAVDRMLTRLDTVRGRGHAVPLVVVSWVSGWRWPEHVLLLLERHAPPSARIHLDSDDPRRLAEIVAAACRRVPLRYSYALLTRSPDRGTASAPDARARLLFPCGTVLPDVGELSVAVPLLASPREDAMTFALPVVVAKGRRMQDWTVVRTGQTRLEPGRRTKVTVILDEPGKLRFDGPEPIAEASFDKDTLLGGPSPEQTPVPAADLLVLLELGGHKTDFVRRITFLRGVLDRLGATWPATGLLRVGVIGYADHTFRAVGRSRSGGEPLRYWGPGSAQDAAQALTGFSPSPLEDDYGAPLEEALEAAAHSGYWRAGARRLLVVLGRRPPHPPRQGRDQALPCPGQLDWEQALHHLRAHLHLRVIAVRDPFPDRSDPWRRPQTVDRIERAWRELGRQDSFVLDSHVPEDVVVRVNRAAGHPAAVPGLMIDMPDGADDGAGPTPGPARSPMPADHADPYYLAVDTRLPGGTAEPEGR